MTEPHLGGTYDDLLDLARWTERRGWVSFARSDHFHLDREPRRDATDAFATLAGLARDTSNVRLCVLVSPVTFRHPAVIAKNGATIDQMSGGRLDLGIGTGWYDFEHEVLGLPFPEWSERFAMLTEALGYVRAAFDGGRFDGERYTVSADILPQPTGTRIVVGGSGKRRTPELAGTWADEYNHFVATPDVIAPKIRVVREAAERAGRDPSAIEVTVMGGVVAGRDRAEADEKVAEVARSRDIPTEDLIERWTENGVPHGTPDQVQSTLASLEEAGVDRLYVQWLDLADRDGLEVTADAVGG